MKLKHISKMLITLLFACPLVACGPTEVPEHDHIWNEGEVSKEPTCTTEGTKAFKCTVEGCLQTKTESIAMLPHSWDEGVVTTAPTCSTTGVKTYTCTNEGCEQTKTVTLEKTNHDYHDHQITVVPDLLTKGEKELKCSICNDVKKEELPARADFEEQFANDKFTWMYASGDSFNPEALTPPSLNSLIKEGDVYKDSKVEISKGYIKASEVAYLMYQYHSDVEKVEAYAHVTFNGNEDSTRASGYVVRFNSLGIIGQYDAIGGDTKSWEYSTPEEKLLTLNDGDYLCVVLNSSAHYEGELSITFTAKCAHVYDEGVVTKEPTETREGILEYTCVACGKKVEHAIPCTDDPLKDYFKFTDTNTDNNFAGTVTGNSWRTDYDHTLHVEISEAGTNIYDGGVFINTGITPEAGKTYNVSFEISKPNPERDNDYQIVFQNKQWDDPADSKKVYKTLFSPVGNVNAEIVIESEKVDSLWIYIQSGDQVNEIALSKMTITQKTDDPLAEYINLIDKTEAIFDNGVIGYSSLSDNGHTLDFKISEPNNIWEGKVFINTGVTLEANKDYQINFEVNGTDDFEVIVTNEKSDNAKFEKYYTPSGAIEKVITVKNSTQGTLWFLIQSGNKVNDISFTKLKVTETTYVPTAFTFIKGGTNPNIYDRFDGTTGYTTVSELNNTISTVSITSKIDGGYRAGIHINTDINMVEEHKYVVRFKTARVSELPFKVILLGEQWGKEYVEINTPGSEYQSDEISVTGANAGKLWIRIEMGNTVNKVELFDIAVIDTSETPVPVVEDLVLTDKVTSRFDGENIVGNYGVDTSDNTKAYVEVIANPYKEGDAWRGGMFINPNNYIGEGDTYKVSFDAVSQYGSEFNVILQNAQFGEQRFATINVTASENHYEVDITGTDTINGNLWLYIECGNVLDNITISNLIVK